MLEVRNLKKSFGETTVLGGVDFAIEPGEIVGLIGASGSGKTVLAKCLVGLETADSGELTLDQQTYALPEGLARRWEPIRERVGYVSQARALPPYRTILDLISEGPRYVQGKTKQEAEETSYDLLEQFQLQGHSHKFPAEISGGQLARVCMARALAMSPDYLICDEVTANLDPIASESVGDLLLGSRKNGVGIIVISHQLGFIRKHANRVDFLADGKIHASGIPEVVFMSSNNQLLAEFIAADTVAF